MDVVITAPADPMVITGAENDADVTNAPVNTFACKVICGVPGKPNATVPVEINVKLPPEKENVPPAIRVEVLCRSESSVRIE